MSIRSATCVTALACTALAAPLSAQTLQDRIDAVRAQRAIEAQAQPPELRVDEKLGAPISVRYTGVGFREALEAWSQQAGVRLLVNWAAFENDGVDLEQPVTLELDDLPAAQVLLILMDVGSTDFRFIAEIENWGVQLRTREQANRDVQVRVYDVADLVMDMPNFDDAPEFDLGEALEGGSGSGGGSSTGIFGDNDEESETEATTRQERGDELAETIRQTVEPDIWRANGGQWSTARYRDGRLIVRAPAYVHTQIGGAAVTPQQTGFAVRTSAAARSSNGTSPNENAAGEGRGNGVAGVAKPAGDVAGVAE